MKTLTIILVGCLLVSLVGCQQTPVEIQLSKLRKENTELTRQAEQLKKQIQVLADLPSEVKLENLYNLQKVKITRYTNLYDKDKDGRKEKLIVYIKPIDEQGDIIKASGAVDIELWDLNKKGEHALLAQWHTGPDELKKLWYAALVKTNYRLIFDISDKVTDLKKPLTVKLTFTDHLTGKVFKGQKVINP